MTTLVVGSSTMGHTKDDVDFLCDGTDDDVEINAAIQALPSTGGKVLIREGTYNLSSPNSIASITVDKANVMIEGMGSATVLKKNASTMMVYVNADCCTITNLTFDGNKDEIIDNKDCIAVDEPTSNIKITNLIIKNTYKNGILAYCNNSIIENNLIFNNRIGINSYGDNMIIANNISSDNEYSGIASNGNNCSIKSNICFSNLEVGIDVYGDYCVVDGNSCYNNTGGILGIGISNAGNYTVISNNKSDNNYVGMLISRTNVVVEANTCYGNQGYSIQADTTCSKSIILGNMVWGKNIVNDGTGNLVINNKYS